MRIALADPNSADVALVLERHFALMRANSPAESCHVMTPDALAKEGATVLAARRSDRIVGVGALKVIEPGHGELKSMHTIEEARGTGVARAILKALMETAIEQGLVRLSLESGSAADFAPARKLYQAHGFVECPPFGNYGPDPMSVFMTRAL